MSNSPAAVSFETMTGSPPENYERYFVPTIGSAFATDLVEAAGLGPGDRILDVACGTGVVTRLAAERVGGHGSVTGLDINPGMLAVARSVSNQSIQWREASAEDLPFDNGSFDVVLCSLGLEFVADKSRALGEIHRVLRPAGRLAINGVGPIPPVFAALAEGLEHHVGADAASFVRQVFSFHDISEIQDLLDEAGFRDVEVQSTTLHIELPPARPSLWQYVHSTPMAAAVAAIGKEARASFEREVVAAWEPFVVDGALVIEPRAIVATGRRG